MEEKPQGNGSPKAEPVRSENNEDAETRATRRELKQSTISDPDSTVSSAIDSSTEDQAARPATPDADDTLPDQVLSPKKKRAHDQLDQDKQADDNEGTSIASVDSTKDTESRSEPQKKRHRDQESSDDKESKDQLSESRSTKEDTGTGQRTTPSAFANSSFGKLATSASPFVSLGAAKNSGFGAAGTPTLASFASQPSPAKSPQAAAPKLTFGGGSNASPFAGLSRNTNGLSGGFSGGFGSGLSGAKPLGSFANPGSGPLVSEKPAKPFGAPESDVEDEDDGDEADDASQPDEERATSPEKEAEDKKKTKLHKVDIDDGEAGEATIVSVRAKMFYHDKAAGNWKERGAGMLKINVPRACIEVDEAGTPVPGSFDASGLEMDRADDEDGSKAHKVARLILRQDQTHRVILNTAILPATNFQEKASLKAVVILFTAFEGIDATPVSISMKMSAANAKVFMNEINAIKRELQGN